MAQMAGLDGPWEMASVSVSLAGAEQGSTQGEAMLAPTRLLRFQSWASVSPSISQMPTDVT